MKQNEYIIDGFIKFSASGETLSLLEHPETCIVLTPACNRLLVYLISNQGTVLSRDAIFLSLWEKYGGTPSNSSLNTYISLIRKAFLNLGYNGEIITTIPKTGFLLNPDISIKKICVDADKHDSNNTQQEEIISLNHNLIYDNSSSKEIMEAEVNISLKKRRFFIVENLSRIANNHIWFYSIAICILLSLIALYLLTITETELSITPVKAGKLNNCDIMFLPVRTGDPVLLSLSQAKYFIGKSGLSCQKNGVYYVYADKNVTARHNGKVYVSYCDYNKKKATRCSDFVGDNLTLPNEP